MLPDFATGLSTTDALMPRSTTDQPKPVLKERGASSHVGSSHSSSRAMGQELHAQAAGEESVGVEAAAVG